jgi:phage terminase large subunit-like protein
MLSASSIALLPPSARAELIQSLSPTEASKLLYEWRFWARPEQLEPIGEWFVWLLMAGRGFGKTRTGAQWVHQRAANGAKRIALVARTAAEVRDVIVEGESGILACAPPWARPRYEPSKRRITWPNGTIATTYSADEPDALRGPQHDTGWADELATWQYPDAWDQLKFGLRLGTKPRICVTTTPRPTPIIRALVKDSATHVTRGSTFDNVANLAASFIDEVRRQYEGTRLGRQELYAEILDDVEGALWSRDLIDNYRVREAPAEFRRVVVAIDPAVTATEKSDETGIVVAGLGADDHAYVLGDFSGRHTPRDWGVKAIKAYNDFKADRIVAEENNGGQLVEANLRTLLDRVPYRGVRASQGKRTRAEPIASLYEQGRVHHVGMFAALEDQMCTWQPLTGERSPDRMDALVWALTELMFHDTVRRDLSNLRPLR